MENKPQKHFTKGGIAIEDIKIGDIHYEFEYSMCIKSEVISTPVRDNEGGWTWQSKSLSDGKIIDYMVTEGLAHYGPNLYNYEAYSGCTMI